MDGDGVIISVVNNKGGVGKTTICCNLGAALANLKKRVLVIDLDSQCNATGILLPNYVMVRHSLYELLDPGEDAEEVSVKDCIYLSKHRRLYCLPNVEETAGLELDLIKRYPESLTFLRKKIINYVKKHFDFTLIDNPPNIGIFVANSLYASDFVIVPNDVGSAYSLDGIRRAFELILSIQKSGNPNLRFLRLLFNKVDRRTSISNIIIDDITSRFEEYEILKTTIPVNTAIQKAEYAKQTLFRHTPTARATKAFRQLAIELLSILEENDNTPDEKA